jgi:[CysO sulfur-carrier protein]-S-L-cysteine hydrolase
VVIPPELRYAIADHARAEAPNEACGLLALRDGVAVQYIPGINDAESPFRFQLRLADPESWFLEDEGYELAIVHSHPPGAPTGARPSRTDVENIGLWEGRPYLVYSLGADELRAYRIAGGEIAEEPVT